MECIEAYAQENRVDLLAFLFIFFFFPPALDGMFSKSASWLLGGAGGPIVLGTELFRKQKVVEFKVESTVRDRRSNQSKS